MANPKIPSSSFADWIALFRLEEGTLDGAAPRRYSARAGNAVATRLMVHCPAIIHTRRKIANYRSSVRVMVAGLR